MIEEIKNLIVSRLGAEAIIEANDKVLQPFICVQVAKLAEVGQILYENDFDHLACLTGIDNGREAGTMEVVYHFYSILKNAMVVIKVKVNRNQAGEPLPCVPSLSHIWKGADWLERETYDLVGIHFEGHQDLRRILLPADWQGFPLRKDYEEQATYHGIQVKY
jgi:NADH-quinone oxidoreductase subunit C